LAIALLTQDDGISQEAYEILYEMLDGNLDITGHVEATDGRFYLPTGWEPTNDKPLESLDDFLREELGDKDASLFLK
jgi:hypothetical protein